MTASTVTNVNVDPAEIEKFSALASRWWDPDSEFKPLHAINPLRLDWILSYTGSLAGKQVLDVGCGGGILSESLAQSGADVTGIDLAERSLKIARLHSLESGVPVKYEMVSAEDMADQHPARFDVVTCMEMLEHVPDPASVVAACARLVKPGGHVFFSTINRNNKAWLMAIFGAEYVLKMVPKGTHDIKKFIKPSELLGMIDRTSLSERHIMGLHYNPLTDHFKLGPNVDVNYMIHTQSEESTTL